MDNRVINILTNKSKYSNEIQEKLVDCLEANGFTPSLEFNKDAELIITIGGDGSFLHAVRNNGFPNIPFIGINTGSLGFYPELSPNDIANFIKNYKLKNYTIYDINVVEGIILNKEKSMHLYAINEIAIKGASSKTIHLDIFVDNNHLQTISGDGVIISTPLGSSAYNYSSGGSLVYPSLKTLQITPIVPLISNAYRCLNSSVIVPPEFEVVITPEQKYTNSVVFYADGEEYEFSNVDKAKFFMSKKTIKKLTIGNYNYWKVIKEKFL